MKQAVGFPLRANLRGDETEASESPSLICECRRPVELRSAGLVTSGWTSTRSPRLI
jgi:hypothetical protein